MVIQKQMTIILIQRNKIDMNKKEKQLLIKDLSARLSYGVKVIIQKHFGDYPKTVQAVHKDASIIVDEMLRFDYFEYKPYLRSMISITEEEKIEWKQFVNSPNGKSIRRTPYCIKYIDWLNEHMFDYRGLIKKGLALEASQDMYNTK